MQIKPNILKIPEDNPFSDDKLNRSQAADVLTQLVSTIREPFVLAIDSPWGTGKSTFISMWMASLRKNGFPCLCFNAWDSDFTGDPLVSFIGEMQTGLDLSHLKGEARSKADAYFSKSTQLLGTFAKKSAPLLVKVLTRGALEVEDLKRLIDLKGFGIEDLAGSLLKDKIEQYEDNKNTIKVFKAHLKDFATHLANGKDGAYKPLCFFIDELDRCRPTYAIELLEKIKHLFNVEGIIFVLAIDKIQIGHSIRSVYGSGMDVDGYLRRFIDVDYRLPEPTMVEFCDSLCHRFNLVDHIKGRHEASEVLSGFVQSFSMLSEIFQLSLRTIEQSFAQLNFVLRTTPTNHQVFPHLVAFLIAFKAKDSQAYHNFTSGKVDLDTPLTFIKGQPGSQKFLDSQAGMELEVALSLGTCNGHDTSKIKQKYMDIIKTKGESSPEGKRTQEKLDILRWMAQVNAYAAFRQIIRRIEFAERLIAPPL